MANEHVNIIVLNVITRDKTIKQGDAMSEAKILLTSSRVVATSLNGNFISLTFKRLKNGLFKVCRSSYDKDGYYRAGLSFDIETDWDTIEREISASQDAAKDGLIESITINN